MSITLSCECHCLESNTFSKFLFPLEVLGIFPTYVKRYFQEQQWSAFFFRAQVSHILLFLRMLVSDRSKIRVWKRYLFQNFSCYGSFWYVSTLRKKVYLAAPVKDLFLYGSNNSDSVVFRNAGFGESQFENNTFSIICFAMEIWRICLSYVLRYFQEPQWSAFSVRAQISQILLFSRMLILEWSKITV